MASSFDELRAERLNKLELLKKAGMDPYPNEVHRSATIGEFLENFERLETSAESVTLDGRILSFRLHGALAFLDISDGTGRVQTFFKKGDIAEDLFDLLVAAVDMGDFIEVTGTAAVTKTGQQSLMATGWRMLAKSIRPIPDGWYGLKDEEERYRRRYLDILLNEEVLDRVKKRSLFWQTIRTYLLDKGFIEVETPVLENTTGGADARPFITHHNALDIDVYLRISAGELWQKKLLVAGLPKVFEIGRIFRNEGMSREHLQDYTQLEFYMAYADYRVGMEMIKELYRLLAEKLFGSQTFTIFDHTVDLGAEWKVYDFSTCLKDEYGIDPLATSVEEVRKALDTAGIAYEKEQLNVERGVDLLWKKLRKTLSGPGFLIGVPVYLEPLAKRSRDDDRVVERFQVILAGSEVGKGFSELNDPVDQKGRFEHQEELRAAGDDEAHMNDFEYVEALEYGMPPAFGFGVSERLFSFLMGVDLREGQIFPLMRPKDN